MEYTEFFFYGIMKHCKVLERLSIRNAHNSVLPHRHGMDSEIEQLPLPHGVRNGDPNPNRIPFPHAVVMHCIQHAPPPRHCCAGSVVAGLARIRQCFQNKRPGESTWCKHTAGGPITTRFNTTTGVIQNSRNIVIIQIFVMTMVVLKTQTNNELKHRIQQPRAREVSPRINASL